MPPVTQEYRLIIGPGLRIGRQGAQREAASLPARVHLSEPCRRRVYAEVQGKKGFLPPSAGIFRPRPLGKRRYEGIRERGGRAGRAHKEGRPASADLTEPPEYLQPVRLKPLTRIVERAIGPEVHHRCGHIIGQVAIVT